jgi:hypothetical protein
MKTLIVLLMLWTNPNGTQGHLVLKSDYTNAVDCAAGANHADERANLLDKVPDDLVFQCFDKAVIDPTWFQ